MATSNIVTVTRENFDQEVLKSPIPVLVDFWADWCGPCKMLEPVLEELAQEYNGKIKLAKVRADTQQELVNQYNIRAVPTLLLFWNGRVRNQMVGLRSKEEIKEALASVLKFSSQ
jgi:thioredoxin 1